MKTFSASLVCVALLLASRAAADDLDELLRGDANVTREVEQVSQPVDVSAAKAPTFVDHHDLHATVVASASQNPASVSTAAVDQKADETGGISLVPEPSAIALAICALAYFLFFGRRRTLA